MNHRFVHKPQLLFALFHHLSITFPVDASMDFNQRYPIRDECSTHLEFRPQAVFQPNQEILCYKTANQAEVCAVDSFPLFILFALLWVYINGTLDASVT